MPPEREEDPQVRLSSEAAAIAAAYPAKTTQRESMSPKTA